MKKTRVKVPIRRSCGHTDYTPINPRKRQGYISSNGRKANVDYMRRTPCVECKNPGRSVQFHA